MNNKNVGDMLDGILTQSTQKKLGYTEVNRRTVEKQ